MAIDTDAFYRESCEKGFVQLEAIARNIAWTTDTAWGRLEITINLSKPEKDPVAIANAVASEGGMAPRCDSTAPRKAAGGCALVKGAGQSSGGPGIPDADLHPDDVDSSESDAIPPDCSGNPAIRSGPCQLCVTERDVRLGYAKRITLCGEPWGMWYSPYAYFNEHCIVMSWQHRPMRIDRAAFERLFDFADQFPHYFIGSNADLPIVGGSILAHDHFQGGGHVFPLQGAPVIQPFSLPAYPQVEAGVVKWPLSVLRLQGGDRAQMVDAACHVLETWRGYDDPSVGVLAVTDGVPHNTITPLLRVVPGGYQFDLALRCNITSPEHPLGVFHPHAHLHHIKRENIGLIEAMGLAILPPRVRDAMRERNLSRDDVGQLFAQVLECAGVFKWDAPGRAAQQRFLDRLVE